MTITDKLQSSPPSRELDRVIDAAIGAARLHGQDWTIPHYTTSIDAALTLLPDGWDWTIDNADRRDGRPVAFLDMVGPPHSDAEGKGETPALALCIAILKARAE